MSDIVRILQEIKLVIIGEISSKIYYKYDTLFI